MKNQDGGRKREEGASCVSKGFAKRNTKQWFLHLLARPSSTAALHSMRRHHHHSCVRWWQNVDQSWKTARTETHKAIVALTCPSTAALYPPCRHHYHHHRQHHHHHWWEPPSFISCVMEANLRWVFKKKCTTMLLVLTFFHSRTLLVLTFFFRSRPSLHPSPDWSSFRFATPLIVVITWKRKIGFYRCQILPALVFAKLCRLLS